MVVVDIDELKVVLYKWSTCHGMYMVMLLLVSYNKELCIVQNLK